MQLQRLTSMEREKIVNEHEELMELIGKLKEILANPALIDKIIVEELEELKQKFGDDRRTEILGEEPKKLSLEDLVREETVVITCTASGYIKRTSVSSFNKQRRGGKGKIGAKMKEEDALDLVEVASTHSDILAFTHQGKVYSLKAYDLPDLPPAAKGKALAQFDLIMEPDERIARLRTVTSYDADKFVTILSRQGIIKKVSLDQLANIRRNGLRIMNVREGDELLTAHITDGKQNVFIGTAMGRAVCFPEDEFREMGRAATGVKAIRLKEKDYVVGMVIVEKDDMILTITENGFGRRTSLEEYRVQGRAGVGLINMKITERNGLIVDVESVKPTDEIVLLTQSGMTIRFAAQDVRIASRQAIGVRLMSVDEGDKIVGAAKLPSTGEEGTPRRRKGASAEAAGPDSETAGGDPMDMMDVTAEDLEGIADLDEEADDVDEAEEPEDNGQEPEE